VSAPANNTGAPALGFFCVTGNPLVAELYGVVGADFVVVDMEAAPMDKADALSCVQALASTSAAAYVRVPWMERHWIEHALDTGADGVLVPKVDTAVEAEKAVAAAYFPPRGQRGLNPVRASSFFTAFDDYIRTANSRTQCLVQVESRLAVANVGEIAAVPGLSGPWAPRRHGVCGYGGGARLDPRRLRRARPCAGHLRLQPRISPPLRG